MNGQASNQTQDISFEFRGNATDYFKIWIVNLFLSIVTLGFYSPWAKVRSNQYLYGNSYFGDHSFEYTANPVRILVGRLIVVSVYLAFYITGNILGMKEVSLAIMLIFLLFLPFLVRQSIAFRQRYTRFHGLNFKQHSKVSEYYGFFFLHLLLNIITIGFAFPYTMNKFKMLVINKTSYGNSRFDYEGATGEFYIACLIKLNIVMTILFFIFMFIAFLIALINSSIDTKLFTDLFENLENIEDEGISNSSIFATIISFSIIYTYFLSFSLASKGLLEGWVANIVYNRTNLSGFEMKNRWNAFRLAWIYFSNFFITLFSLGFLYPWTKIRVLRYKLANMGFVSINFDLFTSDTYEEESALGEESADFFDLDIGF